MAKTLFYTRGTDVAIFELYQNGKLEKSAIIPKSGSAKVLTFDLGCDCTFVNKSDVQIQIDAYRDFEAQGGVVDYEDGKKSDFVAIDTEFCGSLHFRSTSSQSFDSRFLFPENSVALSGELTLMANAASA